MANWNFIGNTSFDIPGTVIALVLFCFWLYHITGNSKNSRKLIWTFGFIAAAGFVYHLALFSIVFSDTYDIQADKNLISVILFSIQYALEMFIANSILFNEEFREVFKDNPILFQAYTYIYGAAVLTSGFTIFHFISRWLHNRMWLWKNRKKSKTGITHIFIGCNLASHKLADNILSLHKKHHVIFIDLPDEHENTKGLSIVDIISRLFKGSKEAEALGNYPVLKVGRGLSRLARWMENRNNKVYILTDDQNLNVRILEEIWDHQEFQCQIFCHAKKEGIANIYDSIADKGNRITFVDSSYLAVKQLKKDPEGKLLPANFVDIAKDPTTGRNLGYVTSSFKCAVIGFGETGYEALKFLYEYGAFPDKEFGKAEFKCHLFDNRIDTVTAQTRLEYTSLRSSSAKGNEFELHNFRIDSNEFRSTISELLKELNYIVICLGDDALNAIIAFNIVELALKNGRDISKNFCILFKQVHKSRLIQDSVEKANSAYAGCLHTFGALEDIWQEPIITDSDIENMAKGFFKSYTRLSHTILEANRYPAPDWNERLEILRGDCFKSKCTIIRQIEQDYSNCLHMTTKRLLCYPFEGLGETIYDINEGGKHCTEEYKDILEHLAVCEHLRWEASHLMLGYRPTDSKTDDLRKLHNCLKLYQELDETKKHFDWLVVKNSL